MRSENGFAYGAIGADIHVFGDGIPLYLLENWHPSAPPDPGFLRELPSRMLNARFAVVDFTGREAELADLRQWREAGPRLAVRWLHAPGGQGKTRLAAQFARESLGDAWKVVTATHGPGTVFPPPGSQDLRVDSAAGLLLIVDYADRWPLTHLTWLLSNALLHQPTVRTRVLMLARSADVWPAVRGALANYQAGTSAQPLPILLDGGGESGERAEMFTAARDSFATRYGIPAAGIRPPGPLEHPEFGLTLAVHMAALVAVDAHTTGRRPPRDTAGLTVYLLDREHLHWQRLYGDGIHELDPAQRAYSTPSKVINRTVFTAALTGPLDRSTGTTVLDHPQLRAPAGQITTEQILADHAVCYPPSHPAQQTVLEPLYPDRLAEDFLALTFPGHRVDYPAQEWAGAVTSALLIRGGEDTPASWTPRAITFLTTAAKRWPHLGPKHLYPLLEEDPRLAVTAGSAALTALADLDDISPELLEAVEDHLPKQRHVDLDVGIAALAKRLAEHRLARFSDTAVHAVIYLTLGSRLSNAGWREEALAATQEAVALFRHLLGSGASASSEPGYVSASVDHVEALASGLTSLGRAFSQLGRREEALAATRESLALSRRLVQVDPAAYEPQLASVLTNLNVHLAWSGLREEGLAATEEAIAVYRRLADDDPAAHSDGLATALENLAAGLADVARHDDALSATQEAVLLRRCQVSVNAPAYEPNLAGALHNLGVGLSRVGRLEEALTASEEAVALERRLREANPAAHQGLTRALSNLSENLVKLGRSHEGVAVAEEAMVLARRLAEDEPGAHARTLADSLGSLGDALTAVGRFQEAVTAVEEAVAVRRRLAEDHPTANALELSGALDSLSTHLRMVDRRQESVSTAEEAVLLRRRLAETNPSAYSPQLAQSLVNLSRSLLGTGHRHWDAVGAAKEAVAIRQGSTLTGAAYASGLADALLAAGVTLSAVGRWQESVTAVETGVDMLRRLAASDPVVHTASLAKGLDDLCLCASRAHEWDKALGTADEAVAMYRGLVQAAPGAHELRLAAVLSQLSIARLELGLRHTALMPAMEAVDLYRRLAESEPASVAADLAGTLSGQLGVALTAAGRHQEALAATEEAITILRRLSAIDRPAHEPALGVALYNMALGVIVKTCGPGS
ncbi:tetratricopeptide repeat protein [Streptomyces sp. NPDC057543]|uniref:tetratricopeptide repeat protein n=1 Tax=Streptomyces sp. NPDC057543 TaxID=3346163 RepID=UPI00368AFF4C